MTDIDSSGLTEQLRRLDPVDGHRLAAAWSGSEAKQRLLEDTMTMIDNDTARPTANGPEDPRQWRVPAPRRALGRLAVAAVTAGVIGTGVALYAGPQEQASAAGVLQAASTAAGSQDASVPGEGQYLYRKSLFMDPPSMVGDPTPDMFVEVTWEVWVGMDGSYSGTLNRADGSPPERFQDDPAEIQPGDLTYQDRFGPQQYAELLGAGSVAGLLALADDPSELSRRMTGVAEDPQYAPTPCEDDDCIVPVAGRSSQLTVWKMAVELLGWSPALDAALYDVLSRLPDVQLDGPWQDDLGRSGVAVSLSNGLTGDQYVGQQLLFDPHTGDVLSLRYPFVPIDEEKQLAPDDVLRAYDDEVFHLDNAVVDSPDMRP